MKQEINYTEGTLTVKELTEILRISKAIAYKLVSTEGFPATKIGCRIRISKAGFNKWMNTKVYGGDGNMNGNGSGSIYKYDKTVYVQGKDKNADKKKVKKVEVCWRVRYRYTDDCGRLVLGSKSGFKSKTEALAYLNQQKSTRGCCGDNVGLDNTTNF